MKARFASISLLLLWLVCSANHAAASREPLIGDREVKMGADAAKDVAKELKLSKNEEDLARVKTIGDKIAAVANKLEVEALYGSPKVTPFEYKWYIVEEKDVNAFSLPGGHIYIYRGLLDYVQSDHELAAVIAHEVVHSAHHHMVYLLQKQEKLGNQMAVAILAAMLGGARSSDLGNIFYGIQLLQIAKMNGYGMEAERDADRAAIYYLREAGYNPVGMLTFMERLAKRIQLFDYGIYRSHPLDSERVAATINVLRDLGVPINRRQTTKALSAEVRRDKVGERDLPGVYIADKLIYRPAPDSSMTAEQKAESTAEIINNMLDANLQMHEVRVETEAAAVVARNKALLVVSDQDAELMGKTPSQIAESAGRAIKEILWKQLVDTVH